MGSSAIGFASTHFLISERIHADGNSLICVTDWSSSPYSQAAISDPQVWGAYVARAWTAVADPGERQRVQQLRAHHFAAVASSAF